MSKALSTFLGANDLANVDPSTASQALMDDAGDASLPGDGHYINFSGKLGEYSVGRERASLDLEERFVLNPGSVGRGWTCWKGGKPVGRHRWSVYRSADAVDFIDLEDFGPYNEKAGDGWKDERSFSVKSLDSNLEGSFNTTSVSGCNSVADLQLKIGKQMAALDPCFPIIQFDMTQFEAQGQTNWKPVFNLLGWTDGLSLKAFMEGKLTADQLITGKHPKRAAISKAKPKATKAKGRRATL